MTSDVSSFVTIAKPYVSHKNVPLYFGPQLSMFPSGFLNFLYQLYPE